MKTSKAPFQIQQLHEQFHGYPDWPVYAVRDASNLCLAVVGAVDRATDQFNQGNATLFALAPEMAAALKAVGAVLNMSDETHPDFEDSNADCIQELWYHEAEIRILLAKIDGTWREPGHARQPKPLAELTEKPSAIWRHFVNKDARPGDVANLILERDALRRALADALSWMQGRAPDKSCQLYQGLIDGTYRPWAETSPEHGKELKP